MPEQHPEFPKQAVGVFGSRGALEQALDRLAEARFDQERISVVGMQHVFAGKLKGVRSTVDLAGRGDEIEKTAPIRHVEMNELRTAAIGFPAYAGAIAAGVAAVASGGAAVPGIIAATVSGGVGGGLLGAIFTAWLNKKRADYYDEQIIHGGILLWVTLTTEEEEAKVKELLPSLTVEPVKLVETAQQS